MRIVRLLALTVVMLAIVAAFAPAASARRVITYAGETSAPSWNRFEVTVVKKDSGRRLVIGFRMRYTLTCADASTERWESWSQHWPGTPLGENGEFSDEQDSFDEYRRVDGVVSWAQASGTLEIVVARLTDDHTDSQLCTTGELSWTTDRESSRRALPTLRHEAGVVRTRTSDGVTVERLVERG